MVIDRTVRPVSSAGRTPDLQAGGGWGRGSRVPAWAVRNTFSYLDYFCGISKSINFLSLPQLCEWLKMAFSKHKKTCF